MSATAEDVIATLKSIDATLDAIAKHFGVGAPPVAAPQHDVPDLAPARDLDGKYGDPEVKAKDPRDWTGDVMRGRRFSQCSPEYLDLVAARLDYFAEREEDPKKARFNRLDASRARGWAARLRAGWKAPDEAAGFPSDGAAPLTDDDIPF